MGHLINPISFRLGKSRFWNFLFGVNVPSYNVSYYTFLYFSLIELIFFRYFYSSKFSKFKHFFSYNFSNFNSFNSINDFLYLKRKASLSLYFSSRVGFTSRLLINNLFASLFGFEKKIFFSKIVFMDLSYSFYIKRKRFRFFFKRNLPDVFSFLKSFKRKLGLSYGKNYFLTNLYKKGVISGKSKSLYSSFSLGKKKKIRNFFGKNSRFLKKFRYSFFFKKKEFFLKKKRVNAFKILNKRDFFKVNHKSNSYLPIFKKKKLASVKNFYRFKNRLLLFRWKHFEKKYFFENNKKLNFFKSSSRVRVGNRSFRDLFLKRRFFIWLNYGLFRFRRRLRRPRFSMKRVNLRKRRFKWFFSKPDKRYLHFFLRKDFSFFKKSFFSFLIKKGFNFSNLNKFRVLKYKSFLRRYFFFFNNKMFNCLYLLIRRVILRRLIVSFRLRFFRYKRWFLKFFYISRFGLFKIATQMRVRRVILNLSVFRNPNFISAWSIVQHILIKFRLGFKIGIILKHLRGSMGFIKKSVYGYKFCFAGRFTRRQIATYRWLKRGRFLSLNTTSALVDYAFGFSQTRWGVFGVKVWVQKRKKRGRFLGRLY